MKERFPFDGKTAVAYIDDEYAEKRKCRGEILKASFIHEHVNKSISWDGEEHVVSKEDVTGGLQELETFQVREGQV